MTSRVPHSGSLISPHAARPARAGPGPRIASAAMSPLPPDHDHPDEVDAAPVRHAAVPKVQLPARAVVLVRWTCALLSLAIIVARGVAWAMYKEFSNNSPRGAAVPSDASDPDGGAQNILLVGNDTRAGASK